MIEEDSRRIMMLLVGGDVQSGRCKKERRRGGTGFIKKQETLVHLAPN